MTLLLRMEDQFDGRLNVVEAVIKDFEQVPSVGLELRLYDEAVRLQREMKVAREKVENHY